MTKALRQYVKILPGGRIELASPDLPSGADAEVIVLYTPGEIGPPSLFGAFEDDGELLDEIVADAMKFREMPLRMPDDPLAP
ncbi:MAG: hypothetical protein ACKVS9_05625 [Phycisphaerae bacterium]